MNNTKKSMIILILIALCTIGLVVLLSAKKCVSTINSETGQQGGGCYHVWQKAWWESKVKQNTHTKLTYTDTQDSPGSFCGTIKLFKEGGAEVIATFRICEDNIKEAYSDEEYYVVMTDMGRVWKMNIQDKTESFVDTNGSGSFRRITDTPSFPVETVTWELMRKEAIQFDYPVFPNLEVKVTKSGSHDVELLYLEKGLEYTETPPPLRITNLDFMSGIPRSPTESDSSLKLLKNPYGFEYLPYEKMVNYEKKDMHPFDIFISGSNGYREAYFKVDVPDNTKMVQGYDREKIYNIIMNSMRPVNKFEAPKK